MTVETGEETSPAAGDLEQAPAKAPFRARLIIWLIAGVALAGIAAMCITVLVIIATRS